MSDIKRFSDWFESRKKEILEDLFSFLRFRSISADSSCKKEMASCARWLKEYFEKHSDLKSEIVKTSGYPFVFAESKNTSKEEKLLIYGHYDVQPLDPLELWKTPPFEPTMIGDTIYARGALDDKGQIFYAIIAMRAFKELGIEMPIRVCFCIEGEEESASLGLSDYLERDPKKLQADHLLVVDFEQFDRETPAVSLGARGIAALSLELTGSNGDLHSGSYGGIAYNPIRAMVELLAKVWDEEGRVTIPGFYEDVRVLSEEEKKGFSCSLDEESLKKEFGIALIGGERGKSLFEKNALRPTFEINGISGGHSAEGFKTVIAQKAFAKISCRLVPDQDPEKIREGIDRFFRSHLPKGIEMKLHYFGGDRAFRSKVDAKIVRALAKACSSVTGKECKNILAGGSIPIVAKMVEALHVEVAGMGYGLASDQIHAPNEHFDFARFRKGFLTVVKTIGYL